MSDDVLIRVEGTSKKFCRDLKRSLWYGVQDTMRDLTARDPMAELRRDEFWAVDDVSFELRRGECLGLVGRNGAGKTTVLKMLNGLIKPDRGRIEVRGRVGALIALGAGFNPILSGRENIYINGSVLGLRKREIDTKYEEIVDFAEIGEFIHAPVQSYSSGMQMRLGFAVATAIEPEILIIDEVLAVGDIAFQAKCIARIGKLRQSGIGIVFVSHNLHQLIMVCNSGILLENGRKKGRGDLSAIIDLYRSSELQLAAPTMWSGNEMKLDSVHIRDTNSRRPMTSCKPGDAGTLVLRIESAVEEEVLIDLRIVDSLGTMFQASNETFGVNIRIKRGSNEILINWLGLNRQSDNLQFNVAVWRKQPRQILCWSQGAPLRLEPAPLSTGRDFFPLTYDAL